MSTTRFEVHNADSEGRRVGKSKTTVDPEIIDNTQDDMGPSTLIIVKGAGKWGMARHICDMLNSSLR